MEAIAVLGLLGLGYLADSKESNQSPEPDDMEEIVHSEKMPNGNTLYDVDNYNQSIREEQNELDEHYRLLKDETSNRIGIQKTFEKPQLSTLPSDNESNDEYVQSMLSSKYLSASEFLKNDQGISVQPFFKKAPANTELKEGFDLQRHQGRLTEKQGKRGDIAPMFSPEMGRSNIFGTQLGGAPFEMERYVSGLRKDNELPFEQEKVIPIDTKTELNRDIKQQIAERSNIDVLRTLSNQKQTYKGRVVSGNSVYKRGVQGDVSKNRPYSDYINTPDRYLVTGGGVYEKSERPQEIIKYTNRSYLNKQPLGPSAPLPGLSEEMKRPSIQRTMKQQLNMANTTERNVGPTHEKSLDYKQLGYHVYPNEREATTERTYESNLVAPVPEKTTQLMDDIKKTIKQTTLTPANNGYIVSPIDSETVGVQDKIKRTKKETDIYSHYGNAGTITSEEMSRDKYERMETDPTKEIIAQGREPTLSSTKLMSGVDRVNVDIKKLSDDYMTRDTTGLDRVYQKLSSEFPCNITTSKDTLDNDRIMNRIYPELLNPFRQNPLTQPLTSYSY
jgi:hypothetical protein